MDSRLRGNDVWGARVGELIFCEVCHLQVNSSNLVRLLGVIPAKAGIHDFAFPCRLQ